MKVWHKNFLGLGPAIDKNSVSWDTSFSRILGNQNFIVPSRRGGWAGWHTYTLVPQTLECLELNARCGMDLGELLQYFCAIEAKNNLKMFSLHIVLK